MPRLFLLLSISGLAIGSAFSTQRSSVIKQRRALHTTGRPLASTVLAVPRGGANPVAMSLSGYAEGLASVGAALATSVASGSRWTVPALWAVTAPACALAYIRQAYVFSLGYGLSAAAVGAAVLAASAQPVPTIARLHAGGLAAYGVRLFLFLWRRQQKGEGYKEKFKALDTTARLKRTPIILATSLFYALMMSPVAYFAAAAARGAAPLGVWDFRSPASLVASFGLTLMLYGGALEALADFQKSLHKRQRAAGAYGDDAKAWVEIGTWSKNRHANYYGEIVFWFGTFLAGTPAFGGRVLPWVAGGLGFYGILSIMRSATARLVKKQDELYGADPAWAAYAARTPSLWPEPFGELLKVSILCIFGALCAL